MHTQHPITCRAVARTTYITFFAIGALAVALGLPNSASAALLLSNPDTFYSLRYDGHVRNAAGTAFGIEGHSNPSIEFDANSTDVPVSNSPSPPLNPAKVLTVTETEFIGPGSTTHVVLDIKGKGTPEVFTNVMDPNFLVELEAFFVSNDPTKGLKIDLGDPNSVQVENFGTFHLLPSPPNIVQTSGLGTAASPLRLFLGISPNLLPENNGAVKLHFFYTPGPVPEPTTCALVLVGVACVARFRGRRR